jgi:hypothetical protein
VVVERSSTQDGTLKVRVEHDALVTIEEGRDVGGTYVTTQRFRFEKSPFDGERATRLVGYDGGFIKDSTLLQQVLVVEYIPLIGMYEETTLDCPIGFPGVRG